jgi:hypothetical protein
LPAPSASGSPAGAEPRENQPAFLTAAVAPHVPDAMTADFLPRRDRLARVLWNHLERQREAADRAAWRAREEGEGIVFRRDPAGGVDLRAFAVDRQNIHRSSVQTATEHAVHLLLARDVPPDQSTLPEVHAHITALRMPTSHGIRILNEVSTDFLDTVAFASKYGDVLDRVWAYIRSHVEKWELVLRLVQEVHEGIALCANGKMARLVNVLQGYDETLFVAQTPPREAFQELMARLRGKPAAERGPAAAALFEEYRIAEAERGAWLEALDD